MKFIKLCVFSIIFSWITSCGSDDSEISINNYSYCIENSNIVYRHDTIYATNSDTIDFGLKVNEIKISDSDKSYILNNTTSYIAGKVPTNALKTNTKYSIQISDTKYLEASFLKFTFVLKGNSSQIVKKKYIWIDANANFKRFSSKDSIIYYLNKLKNVGITDVIIDVKPPSGDVLYKSSYLAQVINSRGNTRDPNFEYIGTFIEESHKLGLRTLAALNTFSFGTKPYSEGMFCNNKNTEWMTIKNTKYGIVNVLNDPDALQAFANPALSEVQNLMLNVFKEIVTKYHSLDGIIIDRGRYDNLDSDFSQKSKEMFETYAGVTVANFPDDIFKWNNSNGIYTRVRGQYFAKWLEWRASVIYNFFEKARTTIKSINPNITFGTYTGSWFPTYYEVGVNWASKGYDPRTENTISDKTIYTEKYKNFGYAALLDTYMGGAYYPNVEGSGWYTVQGACQNSARIIMGNNPFHGSLDLTQYKNNPDNFRKAVEMCLKESDGIMIFDLCYVISYNWWDLLKQGIDNSKN